MVWLLLPTVKRNCFSEEEEDLIIRLHNLLENRLWIFDCWRNQERHPLSTLRNYISSLKEAAFCFQLANQSESYLNCCN
ncbi:hypothetical protein I3843_06G030000 [Carya illinoinensis]|nr:hypothetical protein I3843_06G030000 [Carya illinoinensis]